MLVQVLARVSRGMGREAQAALQQFLTVGHRSPSTCYIDLNNVEETTMAQLIETVQV